MREEWRFVPGVPHTYMVSNRARVYSVRSQRVIGGYDRQHITVYIDKKPVNVNPEIWCKAAFGLACNNMFDCQDAAHCWRCGNNPVVARERIEHLRERGLTDAGNGLKHFKILPEDLEGWQNIEL